MIHLKQKRIKRNHHQQQQQSLVERNRNYELIELIKDNDEDGYQCNLTIVSMSAL